MLSFIISHEAGNAFNKALEDLEWEQAEEMVQDLGGVMVGVRDEPFVEMLDLDKKWSGTATMMCPQGEDIIIINKTPEETIKAFEDYDWFKRK